MKPHSILIVDDEVLTLRTLRKALEKEGYEIFIAETGEKALEIYANQKPHLVLLDLMLPGISGLEVLKHIKDKDGESIVIMMTAYEIVEKAVEAMKLGAYDYLLKPFKINELKNIIHRSLETLVLRLKVRDHIRSQKGLYYFGKITAESRKMRDVVDLAERVALSDRTTVLIQGESGTGKELLAKAIHYHSPRAEKPLVEINCAAIPETLMESELFGYEPGAFTDAKKRKTGLLEQADEGTVFFDEIGDMSLNLQAKLLRVLEEENFTRLGGNKTIQVNLRVLAATNIDLAKASKEKSFRPDLFYRLNVVPIRIPPLRERKEDIIPLALNFIDELNRELKRSFKGITPKAAETMEEYDWPGNVRELRNIMERIMSLHMDEEIQVHHLPHEIRSRRKLAGTGVLEEKEGAELPTLDDLEKTYIRRVLKLADNNKSRAAQILGIHPTSLFRKLKAWDQ
jgi:two-component system response regulator AtoC